MLGLAALVLAAASVTVPFTVFDNRILVSAAVNGTPGFQMIFDTGSTGLTITPETALRAGVRVSGSNQRITGAGAGSLRSGQARIAGFTVGGAQFTARSALVLDLGAIRRHIGFPHLDGIIGYDALPSRFLNVDMDKHELTMSDQPIAAPKSAHVQAYTLNSGFLQVPGTIDGVASQFILDTGDRSALTVFQPFARQNGFFGITPVRGNAVTGYGVGGPIRANVFGTFLQAFGYDFSDVVTRLPLGNAGAFSAGTQAGSIGNGVLAQFNMTYDRVARTISLWPSHRFAPPRIDTRDAVLPRHAAFGAAMQDRNGKATVSRVIPQSAAAAAGILSGDTIEKVDGATIGDTASFLAYLHTRHAGEKGVVTVVRSGVEKSVAVTFGAPADESDPLAMTSYDAIRVDGTLRRVLVTYPKNDIGRLPAVLLLGGIGCYSVDVAANPQDQYMRLTHDVSQAGFITMRVEKSGVGDSQGPPCDRLDLAAEERGYAAALTALRTNPRVDPDRVFLLGHSIGSLEAPRLAATQKVAGVIAAEAVGRDWPEYEVRNLRRQLELMNTPPAAMDAALLEKHICLVRYLLEKEPEDQIERSDPGCKVPNGVYPASASYMQQVAPIDIIGTWTKIDVPVLAIYGMSDFVTEAADHERIVAVVNAAHPGYATYTPIDGMDHLLFAASSPKAAMDAFYNNSARVYDADLSRTVVAWLKAHAATHP